MTRIFITLLIGILFSSCATLINQRSVDVNVHSDVDSLKICVNNDTSRWYYTPTWINTERSRNDLLITAKKDGVRKLIQINSKLSTAFWLGNMFSGIGVFGYAIDFTNPKRFAYPPFVTINFNSVHPYSTRKYKTWINPEKKLLNFKISIPEGNHFYLNKGHGYGNSFGFLGISGGVEYYFSDKYCINMDIGALTDFMVPFPAPIDYEGGYDRSSAIYGDIQIGSDFNRFHSDLGLQYNRTSYYERETVELFPDYIDTLKYSKFQNNMGLAFSTYYRISNGFNLGINYYPSFLSWDNNKLQTHYSHLLFFEFVFKLEAFRPKKKN